MTSDPTPQAHAATGPEAQGDPDSVTFDVREVPFSRRGCWLNLSPVVAPHRTSDLVHLVSHGNGFHAVVAMTPQVAGSPVETTWLAGPSAFSWVGPRGTVDAALDDAGALRLRGSGLGLRLSDAAARLTPFTGTYLFTDPLDGAHVFTSYETGRRYRVTVLHGTAEVDGAQALGEAARSVLLGGDAGVWEAVVHEATSTGQGAGHLEPFDEVVASARATRSPTTSTATTAAGTTRPPSTSTASSSPRTWRPSSCCSSRCWATWPTSSAGRPPAGAPSATSSSPPCSTSCGPAPSSWPAGRSRAG